jgi:TPR repeat protein
VEQDIEKALPLLLRGGDLGDAKSFRQVACAYMNGVGVERDEAKARHYTELAAIGDCVTSRQNVGVYEDKAGNLDKSIKHSIIAAGYGHPGSLINIRSAFMAGDATRGDYEEALRAYQQYIEEVRSDQRDEAANSDDEESIYLIEGTAEQMQLIRAEINGML